MAATIIALFTNNAVPLVGAADLPTIRIRRLDTDVLVVTDAETTEVGDGYYKYVFDNDVHIEYAARLDGDPDSTGQVTATERYQAASIPSAQKKTGEVWQRHGLDTDNPLTITQDGLLGSQDSGDVELDSVTTNPGSAVVVVVTRQP